ncbi:hypothetical protein [Streptomyces cellulosae]|uniref:hypothetical protein n=1 Tax=Streptomyces cellulosae TaxID=1968 RepID=UPI00131E61FF|nr:hypothetical protein [Streptomyces cellulosae]
MPGRPSTTGSSWRDAGVFQALPQGMITEAARRDEFDMSLISADSTMAHAHHDAAGMRLDQEILAANLAKTGGWHAFQQYRDHALGTTVG